MKCGCRPSGGALLTAIGLAVATWGQSTRAESGEEELWRSLVAMQRAPAPASQSYVERLAAERRRGTELIRRATAYLAQYPGGAHRDEVIRIELAARFDLACLSGATLPAFSTRIDELLRNPPDRDVAAEAAYWRIQADRLQPAAATQPLASRDSPDDPDLVAAYGRYVREHPQGRHTPRLAQLVFDAAAGRDDRELMAAMRSLLEASWPEHPTTQLLAGRMRRVEQVGQPFELRFAAAADGRSVDVSAGRGGRAVVLVWASFDARALAALERLDEAGRRDSSLRLFGVNLDESADRMQRALGERGISWPQMNDGMGWGGSFVRHWGVDRLPTVFVLNSEGRLAGVSSEEHDWRRWLTP